MEKVPHIWSLFVCPSILRRNKTNIKHLQTKYAKISVVWVLGKMLFLKSCLSSSVWNLPGSNRDNKQRSGLFGCALLVNLALLAAIVYLLGKRGARGVKDRETLQSLVCSTNPLFLCNTAGCSLHDPLSGFLHYELKLDAQKKSDFCCLSEQSQVWRVRTRVMWFVFLV